MAMSLHSYSVPSDIGNIYIPEYLHVPVSIYKHTGIRHVFQLKHSSYRINAHYVHNPFYSLSLVQQVLILILNVLAQK